MEIERRYGRESSEFHETLAVQLAGLQTHYSLLSVERSKLLKDLGLALDSQTILNLKEQLRDLEAEIDSVLREFERWYGRESSEFRETLALQLIGLQDYYSMLSKRIMWLDTDLGRTLDSLTQQILNERRHDVEIERDEVVAKMLELEKQIEPNQPFGPAIERRYGRESSEFQDTHAIQHDGLQDYYSTLTKRINALDTDWVRAVDSLERQILKERRHDLEVERDEVVA
jgi:hypothetical protein